MTRTRLGLYGIVFYSPCAVVGNNFQMKMVAVFELIWQQIVQTVPSFKTVYMLNATEHEIYPVNRC